MKFAVDLNLCKIENVCDLVETLIENLNACLFANKETKYMQ